MIKVTLINLPDDTPVPAPRNFRVTGLTTRSTATLFDEWFSVFLKANPTATVDAINRAIALTFPNASIIVEEFTDDQMLTQVMDRTNETKN